MADAEHIILYETPVYGRPERNPLLWHGSDFVANEPFPGNPHFVPTFSATRYRNDRKLYEFAPQDRGSALSFETNTHFIATYKATVYGRTTYPQPNDGPSIIIVDTPMYFIATYQATKFFNDKALYQRPTEDASSALHFETNTHFLAPFTPTKYKVDLTLGQFASIDGLPPPVGPSDVQHVWAMGIVRKPL